MANVGDPCHFTLTWVSWRASWKPSSLRCRLRTFAFGRAWRRLLGCQLFGIHPAFYRVFLSIRLYGETCYHWALVPARFWR